MTTFSERVKIFVLIFWLLSIAAYVCTLNWREKRRAERIMGYLVKLGKLEKRGNLYFAKGVK